MKHALFTALLFMVLPVSAQQVEQPLPLKEQREVGLVGAKLLASTVAVRPDGTARTTHQVGAFMTRIELKGLKIEEISKVTLSAEEQAEGITRRYHAKVRCQAHRIWDGPMVAWSEWRESSYGFLPATIVVEEIHGQLQARAKRIKDFSPGIDATISVATR